MNILKILTSSLSILFLISISALANDFQDGLDAIHRTDYEKALRKLLPLAESGNAAAQYNIGVMHEWGDGVPQNNAEAIRWYRRSAELSHKDAQNNLGAMYSKGEGAEQNFVEALKWFILSGGNGSEGGKKNIGIVEKRMTIEQINEARKLASEWMKQQKIK